MQAKKHNLDTKRSIYEIIKIILTTRAFNLTRHQYIGETQNYMIS